MASELHCRLEYLVNYSSQLIFVSGDSIAEQQRTLETFVFQQSDNTELAFITAEPDMQATEYRGILCKQLLGQVVGSYIRPLNELLAGLNHHDGPVLITITQAQHLPNSFLQELWDLVLQSRFANNKQHLNVLLFGASEWAEQAKEWLPAKNTNTPLLISSQSVSTEHYTSDVDRLLAERRAAFERYRQERGEAGAPPLTDNRLRSPWLWIGITLVFMSCFLAIMGWQYGATMTTLFQPLDGSDPTLSADEKVKSSANQSPIRTLSIEKQRDDPEPLVVVEAPPSASQPRVVDSFDEAMKSIPDTQIISQKSGDMAASQNKTTEGLTNQQVLNQSQSETPEVAAVSVPTEQPISQETAIPLSNDELANSPVGQYWIQVAGMQDLQLAQDFLNDHQLSSQVLLYKTFRYGGDWYVILWSTPAASLVAAQQQLKLLPVFPGSDKAFVKAGSQIKAEIATATNGKE